MFLLDKNFRLYLQKPLANMKDGEIIVKDNNAGMEPVSLTSIESLIFNIRGQQVMFDKDLATLYGVSTKRLNEQVKRNIERFPEDFMFQLTKDECSRSQIATLNSKRGNNLKYAPYVFTENGIAMLSGILRSPTAIAVNIQIMRTFTMMRRFISMDSGIFKRMDLIEYNQLLIQKHQSDSDKRIEDVLNKFEKRNVKPVQGVFYNGQIFDAHTFICDLIRQAKHRIILIDNYIDDSVLKRLDKRAQGVIASIYTLRLHKTLKMDIKLHNAQYPTIDVKIATNFHDRFMIVDDSVYHIGASIKDLGKKTFAFCLLEESPEELLSRII